MSKYGLLISWIFFVTISSGCTLNDKTPPVIKNIETSNKSFSIDCVPTSITITAHITDPSGIKSAVLWYHVGTDKQYKSVNMEFSNGVYNATIQALDLPVGEYGSLEFYITAQDEAGNQSKSELDASSQLLPCVSN